MNRLSACNSVRFTHTSHIFQTQIVVKRCFDYWVVKLIHAGKRGNNSGEVFDLAVHKGDPEVKSKVPTGKFTPRNSGIS